MLLADQIIAGVGQASDRATGGAVRWLAERVKTAERFFISPETMGAVWAMTQTRPSALRDAIAFAAVPHPVTWLEWEGVIAGRPVKSDDTPVPRRFGALLDCSTTSHQLFQVSFAWSAAKAAYHARFPQHDPRHEPITLCPVSILCDWTASWQTRRFAHSGPMETKDEGHGAIDRFLSNPRERDAQEELQRRMLTGDAPGFGPWWQHVLATRGKAFADQTRRQSLQDIEQEVTMLLGILAMINSRNCVETTHEIPSEKLNRARVKSGKAPLQDFSTVTINLSRRDARAAQDGGFSSAEIRQHIVRGHFKIRKTGVYWWRPFIRGAAEAGGIGHARYIVKGGADTDSV
jgi:hypothetical protein